MIDGSHFLEADVWRLRRTELGHLSGGRNYLPTVAATAVTTGIGNGNFQISIGQVETIRTAV